MLALQSYMDTPVMVDKTWGTRSLVRQGIKVSGEEENRKVGWLAGWGRIEGRRVCTYKR